jgi:thiosulfate reductase cytochrome b subunit
MSADRWTYRHAAIVRLTHWINALCLTMLLMSGLQIFNAHPSLYAGDQSHFDRPILSIGAEQRSEGLAGLTIISGHQLTTTGVLGVSKVGDEVAVRAFPSWATVPGAKDLALARRWHFFFAWLLVLNGTVYLAYSVASGHVWRDLVPSLSALRHIGREVLDHMRLRFPKGEEARRYNVLQQLTYLLVIFVLLPLLVLAGLAMSPALDSLIHPLPALLGGRQSARTIHFLAATAITLFVAIHVAMVVASGLFNNMRSMITGRYDLGDGGSR